ALCPPDCDPSDLKECLLDANSRCDANTQFHDKPSSQDKSISIRSLGEHYITIARDLVGVRSFCRMDNNSPREEIDNFCLKCQAIDLSRLLSGGDQEHHLTFED